MSAFGRRTPVIAVFDPILHGAIHPRRTTQAFYSGNTPGSDHKDGWSRAGYGETEQTFWRIAATEWAARHHQESRLP